MKLANYLFFEALSIDLGAATLLEKLTAAGREMQGLNETEEILSKYRSSMPVVKLQPQLSCESIDRP